MFSRKTMFIDEAHQNILCDRRSNATKYRFSRFVSIRKAFVCSLSHHFPLTVLKANEIYAKTRTKSHTSILHSTILPSYCRSDRLSFICANGVGRFKTYSLPTRSGIFPGPESISICSLKSIDDWSCGFHFNNLSYRPGEYP